MFSRIDTDGDGRISQAEAQRFPRLAERFSKIDPMTVTRCRRAQPGLVGVGGQDRILEAAVGHVQCSGQVLDRRGGHEGELRGAEQIARELIRAAVGSVFAGMFDGVDTRKVVEWFDLGGSLPLSDSSAADEVITQTHGVQGLRELTAHAGLAPGAAAPAVASAIDFILEGLYAQKKISRNEDHGYSAAEAAAPRRGARREEPALDEEIRMPAGKKKYYN
jgi:hypothetical protein